MKATVINQILRSMIFFNLIFFSNTDMKAHNITLHSLNQIGQSYLMFMSDVVNGLVHSNDTRLEILFAENLTKIDNRTVLFSNNRNGLLPQIASFQAEHHLKDEAMAQIDIEHATFIPSVETNSVVVYFAWSHINIGKATTMVILQCNKNGQIECIIDVWAKVFAQ